MAAYIISSNTITLFHNGKTFSTGRDTPKANEVIAAIRAESFDKAVELLNIAEQIKTYLHSDLRLVGDDIFYKDQPLENCLTRRILKMRDEGFSIEPMLRFLENLMLNPSRTAVEELYLFLEASDLPITEDGHFLAYKRVRDDYTDCHSGKIRNMVGDTPSMARNSVDDNRENTCSYGLHFASLEYLRNFVGSRLMVLKINPANVVSIPVDYGFSKGRCSGYEVHAELEMPSDFAALENHWSSVYIEADDEDEAEGGDDTGYCDCDCDCDDDEDDDDSNCDCENRCEVEVDYSVAIAKAEADYRRDLDRLYDEQELLNFGCFGLT